MVIAFIGITAYNEYTLYQSEAFLMAMLTIRNIDESLKKQLRIQAAEHGCSMEEEVRRILQQAIIGSNQQKGFGSRIHQTVMDISGSADTDFALPPRSLPRAIPDFFSAAP